MRICEVIQISIVADQLSTGQYIGVDELRLVDNGGVDVGCGKAHLSHGAHHQEAVYFFSR